MPSRIVGLSKAQKPTRLLRTIKDRDEDHMTDYVEDRMGRFRRQLQASRTQAPSSSKSKAKVLDEGVSNGGTEPIRPKKKMDAQKPRLTLPDLSDEEDAEPDRGHIHKTDFTRPGQKSNGKEQRRSRISPPGQDHTGAKGGKGKGVQKRSKETSPAPEPRSKRARRDSPKSNAVKRNVFGEEVMDRINGQKKAIKTYGTQKAKAPPSSQERKLTAMERKFGQAGTTKLSSSQGSVSLSQASQGSARKGSPPLENPKFQSYGLDLSDSAKAKSKTHRAPSIGGDFDSSPVQGEGFKKVNDIIPSSPSEAPRVTTYSDLDDTPKAKGRFTLPELTASPTGTNTAREDSPIPISLTSKSTPNPSQEEPRSASSLPVRPAAKPTVCPWCQEPVDAQMLASFSKGKGKRLNVNQQTRFCRKHRRETALEQWSAKGYPEINWDELPDRIASYNEPLHEVILDDEPSHYRRVWAEKIAKGADRVMKKEENMNPGYYGPRGFNLFGDQLVPMFQSVLRERALVDKVISGRGAVAFIQSVLLPELAVRLISDDMLVTLEEARQIMEDSKQLGELVHEEL
ncbi:RTC4-like domain-containing protein [Emericellopsis atlantica]|uniref:Restriction of telomere capping protein 4 n=1 Tax=Emericellopsis atlantica TaxID=2614577 RepID=A0A9P7ZP36_9HYPO|nr:RTC4-like domain-containing protein [Emericellopsis atlantica]KAG9255063.1 RTC4-like domain-containing protein [Emericellopsis atlantica]